MDSTIHSRLVTTLLDIPGMDDYTVRTSLVLNIPYHQHLARHNQDARADITYIVNGLAEMRFLDGTWPLLTFIDNALARVPPGTSLSTQLQELRRLLEDEQTNSLPSSPLVSTSTPSRQAQLTKMDNANDKENNPADIKADILLVTVAEVEAKAILSSFPNPQLSHVGDQTYHDFGMIGGARTFMVQSEMGPGGQSGAILTIQEGITALHPTAVIMVGIAFGVNEQKQHIGDILVSKKIMDYDLQRIGTNPDGTDSKLVIILRGDRPEASPRMLSRFRAAKKYWEAPPEVKFGLVLSGAKLVDNQDFRDQLLKFEPEAIGGEMEGGGLYAAAQRKKVDWILVKAICDWGDGHKKQDEDQRQKEAAENAARFAKYVIEKGGFGSPMLQEPHLYVAHKQSQIYQAGQNSSDINQEDTGEAVNQPSALFEPKIETKDFDVFLSYNSVDGAAVKKIGEDLKKYGILPWLDEWELRPGLPWQRALEQQIRTIKSAAVFVGKSGIGPWHLSEMNAFLRQFKKRNCPVIPVLLPDAPQEPDLPIFLEEMSWVDFRKQELDPLEKLIWGITGQQISLSDRFLILARRYITETQKLAQIAYAPFTEIGDIRPVKCREAINLLNQVNEHLQDFRVLSETTPHLPKVIPSSRENLIVEVDFITEQVHELIPHIEAFRSSKYSVSLETVQLLRQEIKDKFAELVQSIKGLGKLIPG